MTVMRKPDSTKYKQNHAVRVGMSLTDPKVNAFVNACYRRSDFTVCFRKGSKNKPFSSKPLCGQTSRKAKARAGFENVTFDPFMPCFEEIILKDTSPNIALGKRVPDCFQLAIMPGGEGEIQDLITKIVHLWYQVYGVDNFAKLVLTIASPYLEGEEIELSDDGRIIPNAEVAIHESYKTLWGRLPREKAVDDEIDVGAL